MIPLRTANSPLEVLTAMEELYKDEKRWTKWRNAEDESGERVSYDNPYAESFCLVGAIKRFAKDTDIQKATINAIRIACGRSMLISLNDYPSTTIEDIRRIISEAKKRV